MMDDPLPEGRRHRPHPATARYGSGTISPSGLRFTSGEAGSFSFDTGELRGSLRGRGESIGLVPVVHAATGADLGRGEGLFNHYRVFVRGKRFGYGARRWPSSAELNADGGVEVVWEATEDRPLELRGTYRLSAPNTIDLNTTVRARDRLEAFEVFLASYTPSPFIDSRVWASPPALEGGAGFVSAVEELGVWLAFPRDDGAAKIIADGRWELEPHPLDWTMMQAYALPLAIRRDPASGLTLVTLAERETCFAVCTPFGEEPHYSTYLSLFGNDIEPGREAVARSRMVVLRNPSEREILEAAAAFAAETV